MNLIVKFATIPENKGKEMRYRERIKSQNLGKAER